MYAGERLLRGCRGRRSGRLVGDGPRLRLDVRDLLADVAGDVARPEDTERDGDDGADGDEIQLMTSPSRRQATPIANAIGQRLGPDPCGVS